jgi:hypothetical protein
MVRDDHHSFPGLPQISRKRLSNARRGACHDKDFFWHDLTSLSQQIS